MTDAPDPSTMGAINKRKGRETRVDVQTRAGQTAGIETKIKTVEELLAQARDITQEALGRLPDAVVAEVFRQLCLERESRSVPQVDELPGPMH